MKIETFFLGGIVVGSLMAVGASVDAQAPDGGPDVEVGNVWFIRGDVNQDRRVQAGDAFPIIGHLFHIFRALPPPACMDSADANDDGRLDLADPVWILNYLFLGGPKPPAPFPHCGSDPTVDLLRCGAYDACPPQFDLENSIGMAFAYIPPGTFAMGSPDTDPERRPDEAQHLVTLTCGFYMGRAEVTQAQYLEVMGVNPGVGGDSPTENLDRAVNHVTWADAVEFCRRLSEREAAGFHYRLPTEAEWEYACRAGTTTRYWFGDALECVGATDRCVPPCESIEPLEWWCFPFGGAGAGPYPVALKRPSPWGLYDISGNLWEWCSDWYGPYPPNHVIDPVGPATGEKKVLRGGGEYGYANGRSARRFSATGWGLNVGFRVVRDLPDCIRPSVP